MQGLLIAQLAAFIASIANAFLKKGNDVIKKKGALFSFFGFSLLSVVLFSPTIWLTRFSWSIFGLGCLVGVCMVGMLTVLSRALSLGSLGLTVAFQNAGALLTPFIMYSIFGAPFSCTVSLGTIVGAILVFAGLLWSSKKEITRVSASWFWYSLLALLLQGVIMSLYQYRLFVFSKELLPSHFLLFFSESIDADVWFMPGMFTFASLSEGYRWLISFISDNHFNTSPIDYLTPSSIEVVDQAEAIDFPIARFRGIANILFGTAGFLNGIVSFLLLLSTWYVSSTVKAFLFPSFAASVMICCNLVSALFFREKIVWTGSILAAIGVFIGTLA